MLPSRTSICSPVTRAARPTYRKSSICSRLVEVLIVAVDSVLFATTVGSLVDAIRGAVLDGLVIPEIFRGTETESMLPPVDPGAGPEDERLGIRVGAHEEERI